VIKISPCVEYQRCVVCCGDHAPQNSPLLHKRAKNYGRNCAVRPPAKTAKQNLGVGIFGHVNVGIGPRVEYQCWSLLNFALADQKWEFLLLGAESYEFSNNSATLSGFHQIGAMSFCFAYSSCGCVNKLVNMWLMKIS
jgi:hypothetical protein